MAGRGQNGVNRVAMRAQQAIALHQAVALQVPDHGLNGVAPAQLPPDRRGDDAARVGDEDLGRAVQLVTPIAPIHVGSSSVKKAVGVLRRVWERRGTRYAGPRERPREGRTKP